MSCEVEGNYSSSSVRIADKSSWNRDLANKEETYLLDINTTFSIVLLSLHYDYD
jgi:hypothetical protein